MRLALLPVLLVLCIGLLLLLVYSAHDFGENRSLRRQQRQWSSSFDGGARFDNICRKVNCRV